MSIQLPPNLNGMLDQRMATGHYRSKEDALRQALEALEAYESDSQKTDDAIQYFEAGGAGIPVSVAFDAAREAVGNGN
ncbi:MAG: hypothetical protein CMJ78_19310 [Planctomycetaceae bacterium]|nr:hypothetical protein [Planctomycetaceae bacterium]